MREEKFKTILFYRYVNISEENVKSLKDVLKAVCDVLGLKGRILIAREGINGTVEGEADKIEILKKHILSYKYFRKMDIKESLSAGESFPKMKVKIKDEIVSTKYPKHIDPTKKTGKQHESNDFSVGNKVPNGAVHCWRHSPGHRDPVCHRSERNP